MVIRLMILHNRLWLVFLKTIGPSGGPWSWGSRRRTDPAGVRLRPAWAVLLWFRVFLGGTSSSGALRAPREGRVDDGHAARTT
jgi:hypothetical protein